MIEVENLSKRYGRLLAVDGLSFTVRPGRVTGFLGPNGAGKSTTMRLVLGLGRPTSGRVLVEGRPFDDSPWPLRQVGALLDAGDVHHGRTAHHHLRWLARTNRIPRSRVDEVLGTVGLENVAGRRVKGFSLGMLQRLGIAAAMLGDPPVLLFDEPVNGLDPEGVLWLRGMLRNLAAEGRTVFVSSHLMTEMALTADHVVVIGRGRLLADCEVGALAKESAQPFVRVRTPEPDRMRQVLAARGVPVKESPDGALEVYDLDAARLGEVVAANHLTVSEMSTRTPSLEEAYLHVTGQAVEFRGGGDAR